jgi:hypothetical protein
MRQAPLSSTGALYRSEIQLDRPQPGRLEASVPDRQAVATVPHRGSRALRNRDPLGRAHECDPLPLLDEPNGRNLKEHLVCAPSSFAHFLVGKQTDCSASYGWTSVLLAAEGGDSASCTLAGLLASPLLKRSRMSQLTSVPPAWSAAATYAASYTQIFTLCRSWGGICAAPRRWSMSGHRRARAAAAR